MDRKRENSNNEQPLDWKISLLEEFDFPISMAQDELEVDNLNFNPESSIPSVASSHEPISDHGAKHQQFQSQLPIGKALTKAIVTGQLDPVVLQTKIKDLIAEGNCNFLVKDLIKPILESYNHEFATIVLNDSCIQQYLKSQIETMSDTLSLMNGLVSMLPYRISKEVVAYEQTLVYTQSLHETSNTIASGFYTDLNAAAMERAHQSQLEEGKPEVVKTAASNKRKASRLDPQNELLNPENHAEKGAPWKESFRKTLNERIPLLGPIEPAKPSDPTKQKIRKNLLKRMKTPK